MGRSLKKGPFVSQKLLAKIDAQLESGDRKPIKTWSRASMITPDFVGLTFLVLCHRVRHGKHGRPQAW